MDCDYTYVYQVAGRSIVFDRPVQQLSTGGCAESNQRLVSEKNSSGDQTCQVVETEGWLLENHIQLKAEYTPGGVKVDIPGSGSYQVEEDGTRINVIHRPPEDQQFEVSLLGPPLILALALQDVWCVHASAVIYQEVCFVFLGDSGKGKSTLAAYLAGQEGFLLVSDDILAMEVSGNQVRAYSNFPQLKLTGNGQRAHDNGYHPIFSFFLLEEAPQVSRSIVEKGKAASVLIHNTVAARAFNQVLLERHLDFCVRAAGLVPVYQLAYPRDYTSLPDLADMLRSSVITTDKQPFIQEEQ